MFVDDFLQNQWFLANSDVTNTFVRHSTSKYVYFNITKMKISWDISRLKSTKTRGSDQP